MHNTSSRFRFLTTTLSNGLRVATAQIPAALSAAVGLWIGAGSRHEPAKLNGISHFLEHMLFKGTRRLSALDINRAIEGRGGDIEAFTQEETTCLFAHLPATYAWEAFDVLEEMYCQPSLAPADIRRERQIILEEIAMVNDQPEQLAQEVLHSLVWHGHSLGRPLAGSADTVCNFKQRHFQNFKQRHYLPQNTVVVFAGPFDHRQCVARVKKTMQKLAAQTLSPTPPVTNDTPQKHAAVISRAIQQAHLALGFRTFGEHDQRRFALCLLSAMLGEGAGSRLFQTLREKHALAYAVQSTALLFSDTGVLTISAGVDAENLLKALRLIAREIKRLKAHSISPRELRDTREYAIGHLLLATETPVGLMHWAGESLLRYGRIFTHDEIIAALRRVTVEEIRLTAESIFTPARASLAIVGNGAAKKSAAGLQKFFDAIE